MDQLRCGHCGREGFLEEAGNLKLSGQMLAPPVISGEGLDKLDRQVRVIVFRCTRCRGVTLLQYSWWEGYSEPTDRDGLHRVYPEARAVDDLPERVRGRYGKMLELAYEPDAFAMRAGKVLEAVCTDHGYTKGNLGPRLDELIADDRLPPALGDQAHLVREYRNIGSHDDGRLDVEADDVPLIRDFVESLLDYLYWDQRGSCV